MTLPCKGDLTAVPDVFKALAHDVRLKLMCALLEHGEKSVGELEALTGVGQPGLSQQLAILRKAELVCTRRDAKLVFYSLAPEALRVTAKLLSAFAGIGSDQSHSQVKAVGKAGTSDMQARLRASAATFARML